VTEVYNPESRDIERLEALTIEARRLAIARDRSTTQHDRATLERHLREVENRIMRHRLRLRHRRAV